MNKKVTHFLKEAWYFIWDSNSIWSWIVNILLAFLIIKFLVYPGLGFVFSTSHPIVAVVSSSMEHHGSFDQWWNSDAACNSNICTQSKFYSAFNITKAQFLGFHFKNGFNKGDIMFLRGLPPENINVGDIIVFTSNRPDPIIHRVIKKWKEDDIYYFQTKGDHNSQSIKTTLLDEIVINEHRIIGKAVFRIPYLGWIKIAFVGFLRLIGIIK